MKSGIVALVVAIAVGGAVATSYAQSFQFQLSPVEGGIELPLASENSQVGFDPGPAPATDGSALVRDPPDTGDAGLVSGTTETVVEAKTD